MTQSPEYPDLRWVPPKSWTDANRTFVQLVVIHTTEGSEGPTSAEDGAAYDQRRPDGTSTHFFHDSSSTVQCVRTEDLAHAARTQGNKRGIQHELCGRAGQGAAGWADDVSQGTLRQAARQCARDAKKWGIPVRHLTVAQVAAGTPGFCGHVDITQAFPQDQGTHTDPGPSFPWTQFLGMVRDELEDPMADLTVANADVILNRLAERLKNQAGQASPTDELVKQVRAIGQLDGVQVLAKLDALRTTVAALAGKDFTDEGAIAAGVLAGMDYDAFADAVVEKLPQEEAEQLLDALAARLARPAV